MRREQGSVRGGKGKTKENWREREREGIALEKEKLKMAAVTPTSGQSDSTSNYTRVPVRFQKSLCFIEKDQYISILVMSLANHLQPTECYSCSI